MFNIGKSLDDTKGVNNLRGLAIDMINNSGSGHYGVNLGAASIIYTLFKYHININLEDLKFINRDRFVLSTGHAAPLFYSVLYFLGILTLDDLKDLRKINSKTPGHPEYEKTPLVETTTGALGQGVANSVGMAIASSYLNKLTNVVDYYTYVLCGDGELEEGITYEALALAGTLKLNKLIVFLDYNEVTLDSDLKVTSIEDIKKRFESINFNVIDASDDINSIDEAIKNAKESSLPSIIIVKTTIGIYSKYEGTNLAHGNNLTTDDIMDIKEKLGLYQTPFTVSSDVIDEFQTEVLKRSEEINLKYQEKYESSDKKEIIDKINSKNCTYEITNLSLEYENKSLRDLSQDILNKVANDFSFLIGGSADLSSSCRTELKDLEIFNSNNYLGRNIYFGIREHAMAGIVNGLALSGLRPFASTFLAFSDYMRPAIRMSAMMNLPVIYIFTHDSITVGEDGKTHQGVEQLPSLELIPNFKIYRPYDYNELIGAYKEILENNKPSCLIIPRESNEISEYTKATGIENGIYCVLENETDEYINLVSSGEELGITLKLHDNLKEIGTDSRVWSVPCMKNIKNFDLFENKKVVAITLAKKEYFYALTKNVIGMDEFGLSGSKEDLLNYFGFDLKTLEKKILDYLNK